jgi:hypothetical protein
MTPERIEDIRTMGHISGKDWTALCDLALKGLQVEAMREAIKRAVEKAKEGLENGRYASYLEAVAADLEQALNERKEI